MRKNFMPMMHGFAPTCLMSNPYRICRCECSQMMVQMKNFILVIQMSFMRMQMRMCMHMMQMFVLGMSSAKILVEYANMNAAIYGAIENFL